MHVKLPENNNEEIPPQSHGINLHFSVFIERFYAEGPYIGNNAN